MMYESSSGGSSKLPNKQPLRQASNTRTKPDLRYQKSFGGRPLKPNRMRTLSFDRVGRNMRTKKPPPITTEGYLSDSTPKRRPNPNGNKFV